ncbi:hypothetical protein E2C01_085795 [Portunus trituberculatus]|uniref:Uncharacterized protein n=1 Tax=Portunus trituberculatus TaxID=210409 RepID=A0A5B7JEM1_PORTR|nr:hypothetical protein [Portunus trituberculatus]
MRLEWLLGFTPYPVEAKIPAGLSEWDASRLWEEGLHTQDSNGVVVTVGKIFNGVLVMVGKYFNGMAETVGKYFIGVVVIVGKNFQGG